MSNPGVAPRNPIFRHALTIQDMQGEVGSFFVRFAWPRMHVTTLRFRGAETPYLKFLSSSGEEYFEPAKLGMVPMLPPDWNARPMTNDVEVNIRLGYATYRGWWPTVVLVRPEHVNTLPARPYPRTLEEMKKFDWTLSR